MPRPVFAVTVQNEVDTDQEGLMPACLWGQSGEMRFVAEHLGPCFADKNIATKIWILDHNYDLWGRALCELADPLVRKFVDGVAWHGYAGEPHKMTATLHKEGRSLHARILSPDGATFSIACPSRGSPENPNIGYRQLVVEKRESGVDTRIAVQLSVKPFESSMLPLDSW